MKVKESKGYRVFSVVNLIIMLFVVFVTLYPFLYLLAQSFSSEAAIYAGKVSFYPVDFTTRTYQIILGKPDFFVYYGNTILYAVTGTVISLAGTAILA